VVGRAALPGHYSVAAAQVFDSSDRAAYYIPSRPPFVESGAVRQSIHELEDAYPVAQD